MAEYKKGDKVIGTKRRGAGEVEGVFDRVRNTEKGRWLVVKLADGTEGSFRDAHLRHEKRGLVE